MKVEKYNSVGAVVLAAALSAVLCGPARACTGLTVKAGDGSVCFARTLEFAMDLKSDIMFVPRGQSFTADIGDGVTGMKWTGKYAYVGMNAFHRKYTMEATNEKGLHVGLFYFPGYAGYQKILPNQQDKCLGELNLGDWILGNFATLDEVKKNIKKIMLVPHAANFPDFPEFKGTIFPLHWLVMEPSGKAIAIEYIGGKLHISDNPIGVLTNSPDFSWHMRNLNNYVNLGPREAAVHKLGNIKLSPFGSGSGMLGLPGDFTPPSRFVRAAFLSLTAKPAADAQGAVVEGFNLIGNVNIVAGNVQEKGKKGAQYEITWWSAVSDLKNLKFYVRTFDNPDIRVVDMKQLDLDGKEIKTWPVNTPPEFKDVTAAANTGLMPQK